MRTKLEMEMKGTNMEFVSENIIICGIYGKPDNESLYILSEGNSINTNNQLIAHVPFLSILDKKEYSKRVNADVVEMYFTFGCTGLEQAGKDLVKYINLWADFKYKNIILIGHSKAGVCFANAIKWLKKNVALICISSPFGGTIFADKNEIWKKDTSFQFKMYERHFNTYSVDKDIIPNSDFLRNANFSGVRNHICCNVISEIISATSIEDLRYKRLSQVHDLGDSDGIVTTASQERINCAANIYINSSYANSMRRTLSMNLEQCILN